MKNQLEKRTKTRKYLFLAFLGGYGVGHMNTFSKLISERKLIVNAYIGDVDYVMHDKCIYLLCDSEKLTTFYSNFIAEIRTKEYYKDDYIVHGKYHMLVVKIPKEHHNAYDMFTQSKYSKMYSLKFLEDTFKSKAPNRTEFVSFYVMTNDKALREQKAEELNVDPLLLEELDSRIDTQIEVFDAVELGVKPKEYV